MCALLVECFLQVCVCVCVCVCRAVHRHFAGQWLKPEKVAQTRKRDPQCDNIKIEDKGNHITALQQSADLQ